MSVTLRIINKYDLETIMRWRMDPDITKYMNTNPKLTLEGQKKWLDHINDNNNVKYWMVEVDNKPVGVVNLRDMDWQAKSCSWGYYIGEKKLRSLKLAISLEMSLYDYVFDILGFKILCNEVFSLNGGVIKLHQACGSYVIKEVKGEILKEGIRYDLTHMHITSDDWNKIRYLKKYDKVDYDIVINTHH